ncbi:hypothetical protein WJX74_011093 [Apatococcus lobatus]|uniref:Uncharacterized protein n=1 Tax=Apatococcus lobatus TaxID=904363 RepID=A0AAW1RKG0_9CHLO
MADPSPQDAFMLAMHERVVELEAFAATMERRVPELPSSRFKIIQTERGWIFGVTIWEEGWPKELEPFCELGEGLLREISTLAGGLTQNTSLSMCSHDMMGAKREKLGMCLAFQQAFDDTPKDAGFMTMPCRSTICPLDLSRLVARRIMLVEGCVRSSDARLAPEHIATGLEVTFGLYLTGMDENPEALTTQGRTRPTDLTFATCGDRKLQQVALPQLWDDLVMAAHGRRVYFMTMHGDKPEACLPESDDEVFTFERTSENIARVAMASPLGDLDDFAGLDHPAILQALHPLVPGAA